jgi:hypothetical protein
MKFQSFRSDISRSDIQAHCTPKVHESRQYNSPMSSSVTNDKPFHPSIANDIGDRDDLLFATATVHL